MGLNCTNPGGCRFPRGGMCLASCSFTSGPLGQAVEWESADGLYRTTDKAKAANWASAVGVRVVRRATAADVRTVGEFGDLAALDREVEKIRAEDAAGVEGTAK